MVSPAPEVEVDERLVRALLLEQHPDLARRQLVEVGGGWDNVLWRIGDDLLARLPRRALGASLTVNEQRWLPTLSPVLPLPVSAPVRVGRPTREYPWPWSIVPWLAGTPGDQATIGDPRVVAEQLGRFLRALHRPAPEAAPSNPYRGVPLVDRADTFEARVADLGGEIDGARVRAAWEHASGVAPWTGPRTWLHGDLHPANVLLADGVLSAVIDFGDLCAGDPATDLAAAWMLLPPSMFPVVAAAYGGIDADLEARALGWAILFGVLLLAIGLDDRPTYEPIGRRTIDHAVARIRSRPARDRGARARNDAPPAADRLD